MATQRVENMTAKNVAIARAASEAYVTKDRAALENLIADDFHFTSPVDNRLDRETYFRRCWPNSKIIPIRRVRVEHAHSAHVIIAPRSRSSPELVAF
jgi:hypothetical protein